MTIKIDRRIYSDACISKTVYDFLNHYVIERTLDGSFENVTLTPKEDCESGNVEAEFLQKLNDYKLRQIIEEETKDIRTILYAKAFADCEDITEEDLDV